jgi:tetratricopeptide (TPR) repeat protein
MSALAKAPADRFATAAAFAVALEGGTAGGRQGGRAGRAPVLSPTHHSARILAFAALVTAAVLIYRRISAPSPVNASLIAVAPFQVSAADPTLGYLREGMIDLLAATFNGENGPRTVESRSVAGAWSRAASSDGGVDPDEQTSLGLAQRLGAGGLVLGSVVGNGTHLSLRARLLDVPSGRVRGQAVVEGEQDSLQTLVDRLTQQLLGLKAGVDQRRLAGLTSTSLPAVQAYLAGQAAFRRGRFEDAQRSFRQALDVDSTFALAALGLSRSVSTDGDERGTRLAWTYRARLSPGDRAIAEAQAGPAYPLETSMDQGLAAWEAAAAANPDRAEVWYSLGDHYFHFGAGIGLPDALTRADSAFRRGAAVDSLARAQDLPNFPEALGHMLALAAINQDSARARRLMRLARTADSTLVSPGLRWLLAQATGDRIALDSLHQHPELFDGIASDGGTVFTFSQWTGIGVADGEAIMRRWARNPDPTGRQLLNVLLSNGGRPREAAALKLGPLGMAHHYRERAQILAALFWDGDSTAANQGAAMLAPDAEGPIERGVGRVAQYRDICTLEQWRLSRGRTGHTASAIARLRGATFEGVSPQDSAVARNWNEFCATMLEAWLGAETGSPDAGLALERLDSLARGRWPGTGNLVVARLREAAGDLPGALRALRRRGFAFGLLPANLSTFVREEGRVAALTGDTAGAVRAYQHYLALRWNPEPELKAEVDRIRGDLAQLLKEPR